LSWAKAFSSLVSGAESIVVLTHERPDADAVGSLLAISLALEARGKRVCPVMADPIPARYAFLPGSEKVATALPQNSDLIVVVDCAELPRTGFPANALPREADINIDHHPTNTAFGRLNIVVTQAAATTEILYNLLSELVWPISRDVASNLMAGLISDTIGFRTSSVSPATFVVASELLKMPVPYVELYQRLLNNRSFDAVRYWGAGLSKIQRRDGLIWTTLTLGDRASAGYAGSGDADLVDIMTTIAGAQMVLVFVEQTGGKVKVSWRSLNGVDVSRLAGSFGGGGHAPAAGATIPGDMESVVGKVLTATSRSMEAVEAA
jgi:phosphoesterase RecJ-like protein